jgi:GTPase
MLDRVEINLKSGDGGRGAVTFRREKFIPFGGPFGGDGGKGGDAIVKADASVSTLRAYKHSRIFKAENGQPGMTKNKHGKDGEDLILTVPPGTLVSRKGESGENELMADLEEDGQQVVVARGGNGGFGNLHFATATNQAPRIAQPGIPGKEVTVVLELRLIADVGIIGYPNVGKSSLLAALSSAKPKIADYPFTTLEPELGVVDVDRECFILAEIPGLIEGAHAGKGLGHEFLRHAMRTKSLIHLLDGSSPSPLDDMIRVNNELSLFDATLAKRPQVIAINKVDLPEVKARVAELTAVFKEADIVPVFVSAAKGTGLKKLVAETWALLKTTDFGMKVSLKAPTRIFRPQPVDSGYNSQKKGNTYIVSEPELERLLDKYNPADPIDWPEFYERLDILGINQLLSSVGAKSGDTIVTGKKKWEYYTDEYRRARRNV